MATAKKTKTKNTSPKSKKQTTATLTFNGTKEAYEFPVMEGTIGPDVVDLRSLYKQTGRFTYDPGFTSTGSCHSAISYIDGDKGVLLHRGYKIEDLAAKCTFMEVAYLLLNGNLPNKKQKKKFEYDITHHTLVHDQVQYFFRGFRRDAHPMAVMCGAMGGLSAFYNDGINFDTSEERELATHRLVAKVATLAAMTFRYNAGQPFVYPRNDLRYSENFLHMCFSLPSEKYTVNPVLGDAMRKLFILHADHEQNASTSTVRLAASSGANPFACISAGIASLWGPSHGGANEAVLTMLDGIGSVENIPEFIEGVKKKKYRLMGFGHRVYRNYDPRAKVIQKACHDVLKELKMTNNPKLKLALELEKIALNDPYFVDRKLFPNVDFYSGIIYEAMGFPTKFFTVLFAVARTVGWIAQWKELIEDPAFKIGRPRQLYLGEKQRKFVPLTKRR